ncbi:MAG: lasso peptide biosynthesis protein [Thiohalocapsa sp.]|nr:lasso peptide biosynthesis protein [Thiohalocapsa sp.]
MPLEAHAAAGAEPAPAGGRTGEVASASMAAAVLVGCTFALADAEAGALHGADRQAGAPLQQTAATATAPEAGDACADDPVGAAARALGPAVEQLAVRTKPVHWPRKRACLYYALAGQSLLAAHGIPSALYVGDVIYAPGTRLCHPIEPHAWLRTATHFVDFATLPRWGRVTVLPADRIAGADADVVPGRSAVLTLPQAPNPQLSAYLRYHAKRFADMASAMPPPTRRLPRGSPCFGD